MNVRRLNRTALDVWLKGVRLPLSAVETATGRAGETWSGSLAFDRAASAVRTTVGRMTGDEELVAVGRLQDTATAKRTEAIAKRMEAEEIRARARLEAEQRHDRIEETRESVEERAAAQERRLAEEKAAAEQEVEQRAERRRTATRKAARARNKATDRKQTAAEAKIAREEAAALEKAEQAVAAEGTVLSLDRAVRAKKAQRRTG